MSDIDPTIDDNTPLSEVRQAYNRANDRAQANAEAAGRVPHLERENALLRAGGDPDSRVGRLLLGDDEVDWTDRDAVTTAWTEVNPTQPPPTDQPPTDAPDQEALDRQARMDQLRSGGTPPGEEPTEHPWDEAHAIRLDQLRRGRDRERAAAPALDHILEAAVAGDTRVIFDPKKPYSEQFDPR